MKLPLRFGIPLLLVLLVALTAVDGPERTVVVVAAMGVALWAALSLPRPPPKEAEDTLERRLEIDEDEEVELNGGESPAVETQGADPDPEAGEGKEHPDREKSEERD